VGERVVLHPPDVYPVAILVVGDGPRDRHRPGVELAIELLHPGPGILDDGNAGQGRQAGGGGAGEQGGQLPAQPA